MPVHDLREWINNAEKIGELKFFDNAHWDLEIGTITELYQKKQKSPAILFDNIPGYDKGFRVLTNTCCSVKRLALTLEMQDATSPLDITKLWKNNSKLFKPQKVTVKQDAPVFENTLEKKDINLYKFPAPRWHDKDGGRYIGTACLVIMKDPESDWINIGTYRIMISDENHACIMMSPGRHGRQIMEKYWKKNQSCPVTVVLGQDPLLFIVSSMEIPFGVSEMEYAGAIRGKPIDVIKGPYTGLPIPTSAEIAFEGEIKQDQLREEGPFGEWTGYYAGGKKKGPVITIHSLYHRNSPIILGNCPSIPPNEQTFFRGPIRSALLWEQLENAGIPGITGVNTHEAGGARMLLIIRIQQLYPGHSRQAGLIASQCHAGAYANKCVIVIDDDVDIDNTNEIIWACLTRCDPCEDLEILRKCWSTRLDPLSYSKTKGFNNRVIIDACRSWERREDFPEVVKSDQEVINAVLKKWPELYRN